MATQKHRDTLIWGIILIVVGGIFLLETLHVRVWHYVWRLWPVIFIVWGASKVYYGIKEREKKDEPALPQDKGHEI
jgi:hypothetical protein